MYGNEGRSFPRTIAGAVMALSMTIATGAEAAPTASSKAWDISAEVRILGAKLLDLHAPNQVAFAPLDAPFADQKSAIGLDVGDGTLAHLKTGEINVATEWIPGPSFLAVGSKASVAEASLEAVSILNTPPLLSLKADLVSATAIVSGTCPADTPPPVMPRPAGLADGYVFANGFDLENLDENSDVETPGLDIGGSIVTTPLINLPMNPPPNTTIGIPGVLVLILNERTVTGDGITQRGVSSNALHLSVNVIGTITADVILAHAEAAIDCGSD